MDSSHKEYDGMESMPYLKEEPQEFPPNFLCSDEKLDQSTSNCDKSCFSNSDGPKPSLLLSTSVLQSLDDSSPRSDADGIKKQEGLPSKVLCHDVGISESFSESNGAAGPTLFSPTPSCSLPALPPQMCFDLEEPVAIQFLQSQLDGKQKSSHHEETAGSNQNGFGSSDGVGGCVAIPAEELTTIEQVTIKTDEVFINHNEEQFLSKNLSDTALDLVGNGVQNGEELDKFSNEKDASRKRLKVMPLYGSLECIENDPVFTRIRGKKRGRRKKDKSPIIEVIPLTDDVREKVKKNERKGSERAQRTQSSPNEFKGLSFKRMPRKVCERKKTLQNKSSSSFPKACRIQNQRHEGRKLLHGLGVKTFQCTLCKAKFNHGNLLKRHVLEMHEGLPSSNNDSFLPISISVTCPLCNGSYSRKQGMKRHFVRKHFNATNIPCLECKYVAKTLADYMKHIAIHKPKQTEAIDSLYIEESPSDNSQLICRECFKLFHRSDALRLHVIHHRITLCLSQVDSVLPSDGILNSVSSEGNASNHSPPSDLLHIPPSNSPMEEVNNQNLLCCLPQELRLEVENSVGNILKLLSKLDFLARSMRTLSIGCTSSSSQKPLLAINHMTSLSTGLTNLSTALGHVLKSHVQKKDEKDAKASVDDTVERATDNETERVEERKGTMLEGDQEIVQQKAEGLLVLEKDGDELEQENAEEIFQPPSEDIFQENNQQKNDGEREEETFQEKGKGSLHENEKQAVSVENEGAILLEAEKRSQEKDEEAIGRKDEGENVSKKEEVIAEENYATLVLEEIEDSALVENFALDKCLETLTCKPSRKKFKSSERPSFVSSQIQTRRSERQALKASKTAQAEAKTSMRHTVAASKKLKAEAKTSVRQAVTVSKKLKAEAKHPWKEYGDSKWDKMVNDHMSSKTTFGNKCKECGKTFTAFAHLKRHLMIHVDLRPFKCMDCNKSFRSSHHLKKHRVMHSDERPYTCNFCDFATKRAKNLHNHLLTHGDRQRYPCKKCPYEGRTSYELSKHIGKHNPCSLCGYVASDVADYRMHKRSHVVYSCTQCSYSCSANWQLKRHTIKHKAPCDVEKLCCELCGYSCTDRRRWNYHMARHKNKTPLSCTVCDYKCSSRASFDAHKLMHAGLKPYLCSICGESFRRPSTLTNHMLVHKEEKKHVCRTCGRPFRARHNLRVHEMIHTGERKHKCQLCSFACRRNRELAAHMLKHKKHDGKDEDSKTSGSQCESKAE